jgi:hypothetical protein
MWTNLIKSGSTPSLLVCKAPHDDRRIGSSVMLDLCLDLVRRSQHDQVLWIRPEGYRYAPSPDLFEPSDYSAFLEEARNQGMGESSPSRANDDMELMNSMKSIFIKYVQDYQQLKAIAVNYHLMRPMPAAIVLEDGDTICGSSERFIEIVAILTEALESCAQPPQKKSFLGACIILSHRVSSTSQLSTFFDQRVDFCSHEDGVACKLMPLDHSGSLDKFAPTVIVKRKHHGSTVPHRVGDPLLMWTAEVA